MSYQIGFFVSDWNFEVIESFTEGIRRFLGEHEDVSVTIFNDFGMTGRHGSGRGEMNIFSLPEISRLDAIMVESDRSWPEEREEMVLGTARRLGIPIASLNYPMKGCIYVGTDNYRALYDMTEHVIRKHHAKRIALVRGRARSKEARDRERGFVDACIACGIPEDCRRCYDGDWYMEMATRAAREMLQKGETLPDAVICCNDDLAVGVATVLKEAGVRIPEDVVVTGFDNLDISEFFEPTISTVERNYPQTAYTGMQVLYDCLQGKSFTEEVYSPHRLLLRSSCGCCEETTSAKEISGRYLRMSRHLRNLYQIETEFGSAMYSAESISYVMDLIENAAEILSCRDLYVVINTDYLWSYGKKMLDKPYSDTMALMAAWGQDRPKVQCDRANHIYEFFDRESLIPGSLKRENQLLVLYPLSSEEISIGYVAVDGTSPLAEFNVLQLVVQLVGNCIENIQRKRLMNRLYRQVSDMSRHDALTGLYNRFGLSKDGAALCQALFEKKGVLRFFFLDMDGMKAINDTLGHEEGDRAIRVMAEAIEKAGEGRDCFIMRYGGDEFVMIGTMTAEKLEERILDSLEKAEFPMPIGFSLGSYETFDFDVSRMDDYIREADNRMYEVKRNHHTII